jgi:hypothetical protein
MKSTVEFADIKATASLSESLKAPFFIGSAAIEMKAKASFVLSQKVSLPFLICRFPTFGLAASVLTDPHSHLQEPAYIRKEYYYE